MKLLLDTHIVLAIVNNDTARLPKKILDLLTFDGPRYSVSVVSLWEVAIKARIGKLKISSPIEQLDSICEAFALSILPITAHHVLAHVLPEPPTRDPFDRLLLAQAEIEDMQIVTLDRALVGHPLAWQPN